MEKQEFDKLLKIGGFNTKKEFANLFELNPKSVNNWGVSQNIPYWVESWLKNYIELNNAKRKVIDEIIRYDKELPYKNKIDLDYKELEDETLSALIDVLSHHQSMYLINIHNPDFFKDKKNSHSKLIEVNEDLADNFAESTSKAIKGQSVPVPDNEVLQQILNRLEELEEIVKKK